MYVESVPNRSSPPAILLRESYRKEGRVHKRTLANLSKWPPQIIDGLKNILSGNTVLSLDDLERRSGKNYGGLWVIKKIADILSISKVLGRSKKALLVMIMICGRILTQGSRRHLKFWKDGQAVEEVFNIKTFDEDDLYEALDWLEENQEKFENQLFKKRYKNEEINIFLYDITSSYLEGQYNELSEYGYDRDGKKGKKQIVIGLLTDKKGYPIAVEVFKGNTTDSTTVPEQIKKLAERFGAKNVVFVGDRGMIKKKGIDAINEETWHYVTAITKPQIEKLINQDIIQMDLFDDNLVEVEVEEENKKNKSVKIPAGARETEEEQKKIIRYILRRNPLRVKEIRSNRSERMTKIESFHKELNKKLEEKPRSKEETALKDLNQKIRQLKLAKIYTVSVDNRILNLEKDEEALEELSRLDGCYVIKTDVKKEDLSKEDAHTVYKTLTFVEWAFRMMKTGFLEIRPLYHRKANRTRACALIAMFAYMILHHIFQKCHHLDVPLETMIEKLDQIQIQEYKVSGKWIKVLPTVFRKDQQVILDSLKITFPKSLPNK